MNLIQEDGYVRALKAGANLATINLTPPANRDDYLLYKRSRHIMHEKRVRAAIAAADCSISRVSLAETMRHVGPGRQKSGCSVNPRARYFASAVLMSFSKTSLSVRPRCRATTWPFLSMMMVNGMPWSAP